MATHLTSWLPRFDLDEWILRRARYSLMQIARAFRREVRSAFGLRVRPAARAVVLFMRRLRPRRYHMRRRTTTSDSGGFACARHIRLPFY